MTQSERDQISDLLSRDEFADRSVDQVYWTCLDRGLIGCSRSTFYRVARAAQLVGDRRRGRHGAAARGPGRPAPVAAATRVHELWSWDISELRGPGRHRYQLLLAMDVYSRYPVGWSIVASATRNDAVALFRDAFARHGLPTTLHSDNGAQMRSQAMADLLADTVQASFSRPHVSDDNPFSEALFKTIKYDLDMPERFSSIDDARAWMATFLDRYATEHHHAGLSYYTPHQVFTGTVTEARTHRQHHLDRYYQAHPERFHQRPQAPSGPTPTGINLSKAA